MKLSIVTINRNNAEGIRKTLASVAAQTYRDIEHIIIDGASTDGSVDVIREYESANLLSPHPLTIISLSEPDNGIYDAMNKGISKAKGDYLYFLNSGDALASDMVLEEMVGSLDGSDFVVGRVNSWLNGISIGMSPLHTEKDYTMYNMFLNGINHQSVLICKGLQEQYPYDTNWEISGDWKFFIQAIVLHDATIKNVDIVFADFDRTGVSSDGKALIRERMAILEDVLPPRIAKDYLKVLPNYYEVTRITWLMHHPFFYRVYRAWTSFGRKLLGNR